MNRSQQNGAGRRRVWVLQAYDFKHMSLDLYIVITNLNPRTMMFRLVFVNSVMVSIVVH